MAKNKDKDLQDDQLDFQDIGGIPSQALPSIASSITESSVFDENCVCTLPDFGTETQNQNCPTCLERSEICDWFFDCEGDVAGEAANQIEGWVNPEDDELVNTTAITSWISASVSNTGAGKVRKLSVRGGKTSSDPTTIAGPKDSIFIGTTTHTVTMEVFPLCQKTRYGLRKMQKGGTFPMWYKTIGGGFYGGKCGIPTSIKSVKFDNEVGLDTYAKAIVVLEWKSARDPDRDFYDVGI